MVDPESKEGKILEAAGKGFKGFKHLRTFNRRIRLRVNDEEECLKKLGEALTVRCANPELKGLEIR